MVEGSGGDEEEKSMWEMRERIFGEEVEREGRGGEERRCEDVGDVDTRLVQSV